MRARDRAMPDRADPRRRVATSVVAERCRSHPQRQHDRVGRQPIADEASGTLEPSFHLLQAERARRREHVARTHTASAIDATARTACVLASPRTTKDPRRSPATIRTTSRGMVGRRKRRYVQSSNTVYGRYSATFTATSPIHNSVRPPGSSSGPARRAQRAACTCPIASRRIDRDLPGCEQPGTARHWDHMPDESGDP
jgi:hypothetical protein